MSISDVKQFYQEAARDSALQKQLDRATDSESLTNTILKLSKQKGYSFTRQDVREYYAEMNSLAQEFSEDDLSMLAKSVEQVFGSGTEENK